MNSLALSLHHNRVCFQSFCMENITFNMLRKDDRATQFCKNDVAVQADVMSHTFSLTRTPSVFISSRRLKPEITNRDDVFAQFRLFRSAHCEDGINGNAGSLDA